MCSSGDVSLVILVMLTGVLCAVMPCAAEGPKPMCHNREVYTNNTCITHSKQPFEYDMFDKHDLALSGPSNTTMPYTARNRHYLGVEYRFQGLWDLEQAKARGVDVGSVVYPEMSPQGVEVAARALLGLQ